MQAFFCAFGKLRSPKKLRFLKKLRCYFLQKNCFPEFSAHIKSYRQDFEKKSMKYHSKTTRTWCFRPYLTKLLVNLGKTQVHPRKNSGSTEKTQVREGKNSGFRKLSDPVVVVKVHKKSLT